LSLHRQHDGKLNHHDGNSAPSVAQKAWQEMLPVNRIANGTLFSLRVQGAAVTTKTPKGNQTTVESKKL
jgi:hypothetical protein